jgi:hypothetical protein
MKTMINNTIGFFVLAIFILSFSACEDLFHDPTKDKDTGEDVTLLLLDRNFIKTKLQVWFVDARTGEQIEDEYIELQIWGDNADRLITFSGEKPDAFSTEIGFLELGYDPNFPVSKEDPLSITIMAAGPLAISAPLYLSYTQEGVKDVIIRMNKIGEAGLFKSEPFREPFDIKFNGVLNSPDLRFITDLTGSETGTAYDYINLYSSMAQGVILCENIEDELLYDDFGIYFTSPSTDNSLVPPAAPVREQVLFPGDYVFTTVLESGIEMCGDGMMISVDSESGDPGTGSFSYLITYSNGDTKSGQVSGTFPIEVLIEPVYYPELDPSVMVQVFGDAQYEISGPVNLSTPCGGLAEFTASPRINLKRYKFITQYICPDNPIGIALSINGQFRRTATIEPWTSFSFVEGICELQLVEGSEYDFRVPIDGEFQKYTLPTDPDELETFLQENQGEDYRIVELTISPEEDKTVVFAVVEVSASVCESLSGGGDDR